jgi:hypothetical protein
LLLRNPDQARVRGFRRLLPAGARQEIHDNQRAR